MRFPAKESDIKPNTVFQRKDNLLFNHVDNEIVMLSIDNSEYYGMDKVGSYIWELMENPISFDDIINQLLDKYRVTRDQCINDTKAFLLKLIEKKMILIL